ncbi:hypothetical protein NF27_HQ00070 [Candidatus Jidaibacter acanthamoeba]|uniref:Ankyrin repeat protein n=1 Tax=Candidatus Jidaibacter acanthamoebae TaxID=86105 RepID=A0A0C1QFZ1_9RICK|nr:hypothetical protein [Candidatus Jidaibacter acanthamoeba]KIE04469.1 hypothetical protein NF27_HQ00070 [Candidatus Jidaibacter acanthamoeba]
MRHKSEIQKFIISYEWKSLYEYIFCQDIKLIDLNGIYQYHKSRNRYSFADRTVLPAHIPDKASLLTIATQAAEEDLVNLLLNKGCEINPGFGRTPLEVLLENLFRRHEPDFRYDDFKGKQLLLIEKILNHALTNNIKINLEKIPLQTTSPSSSTSCSSLKLPDNLEYNPHKFNYLQIICCGKPPELRIDVKSLFSIIKLLISCGDDVYYLNERKKSLIDCIRDIKILEIILEVGKFTSEFINKHIYNYKSQESRFKSLPETKLLSSKIKALSAYQDYKNYQMNIIEKPLVTQALMTIIFPIALSDEAEVAFRESLNARDILNLKLTCKSIYNNANEKKPISYIEYIKNERKAPKQVGNPILI